MQVPSLNPESPPFTFTFVLLPKYNSLTLAALFEPLRIANYCAGRTLYEWRFLSADGADVPACSGMTVPTNAISMDDEIGRAHV